MTRTHVKLILLPVFLAAISNLFIACTNAVPAEPDIQIGADTPIIDFIKDGISEYVIVRAHNAGVDEIGDK